MTPSRAFMVQQSILTAIGNRMPGAVACDGPAKTLSWLTSLWGEELHPEFLSDVRRNFRSLASRYGAAQ